MISADGTSVGFNGVALGRSQVYGTVADAVCVQSPRHRCPSSWCDCGFYCFHDADAARALACDEQYGRSVLLEILASGRFVSYELGLRYQRQTVTAVRVGSCRCGGAPVALVDLGSGVVGWRRLEVVCRDCAGRRAVLPLEEFARLCGVAVGLDEGIERSVLAPLAPLPADPTHRPGPDEVPTTDGAGPAPGAPTTGPALAPAPSGLTPEAEFSLLAAEVTLLQARLDDVQRRLQALTEGPS